MNSKAKISFFCSSCGYESAKWMGRCPSCNAWNSFTEELVRKESAVEKLKTKHYQKNSEKAAPIPIQDVRSENKQRFDTRDKEFNRVLGGGLVAGSIILLGGQPGIGKSTLLLQMALRIDAKVLYVSGEESGEQIKMRALRLGIENQQCLIYNATSTQDILENALKHQPGLLIIDSIQTIHSPFLDSPAGSISQVRECTAELQRFAKETNIPVILIGHITKDGSLAGPKVLEHIVDVVLQFEGEHNYSYRILRTIKNRFGSTDELGIYEMRMDGLREVNNPSEILISQSDGHLSGSAIAASIEGLRPLLIETQALVSRSVYGTPQRSATGFDLRRLSMLLAVLEKRCGLPFALQDVFLNIAGGIKVSDPAIDLAIATALISSLQDIAIPHRFCFAAEIGLSGEIRAVSRVEQRIQEAERLGFQHIYISSFNTKGLNVGKYSINIKTVSRLEDLLTDVFA